MTSSERGSEVRWMRNLDGSIMADEDGKAVTVEFYEMQRPVAKRVWEEFQRTGDWFQASVTFGEGPEWGQAICKRYGLLRETCP